MPDDNQYLSKLKNLGEASEQMLVDAGIRNVSDLKELGAVAAYMRVVRAGGQPSMNLLYAMSAGLEDREWTDLSQEEKSQLIMELEDRRELEEWSDRGC